MAIHRGTPRRRAGISAGCRLTVLYLSDNTGGSAWESNPPKTLLMPPNGFEVREAHRDSSAPGTSQVYTTNLKHAIIEVFESPLLEVLSGDLIKTKGGWGLKMKPEGVMSINKPVTAHPGWATILPAD